MIRVIMRGFLKGDPVFTDHQEIDPDDIEGLIGRVAEQHARMMAAGEIDMIEIEWLDEPDPLQRFFRIGTNPAGMVLPHRIA